MASVIPVAKALYLCDDILSDPARVKPHLIGVLNAIQVPTFPHTLDKLCVFAKLVGGLGDVRCHVEVVSAASGEVVYRSPTRVVRFDDRRQTRYYFLKLAQIILPAAGEFWVEFFCNGQFMDDATLRIYQ
jgi:hypothetical protein